MTPKDAARKYFIDQIPVDVVTDRRVNALARVISAAVSAERDACAKVAETTTLAFYDTKTCREISAAIRSRK